VYAIIEPCCNYYYNIIRENNPKLKTWVDQNPREKWSLAYDQGRR